MKNLDVYPSEKRTQFTNVRDKSGREYICASDVLKNPSKPTKEELSNCIDESRTLQPSAGG